MSWSPHIKTNISVRLGRWTMLLYNTLNYHHKSVSMRNSERWIWFSIFVDKFPPPPPPIVHFSFLCAKTTTFELTQQQYFSIMIILVFRDFSIRYSCLHCRAEPALVWLVLIKKKCTITSNYLILLYKYTSSPRCPLIRLNRDSIPKLPILSRTSLLGYKILCLLPYVFSFLSVQPLTVVLFTERMANIISKFLHKLHICGNIISHWRQHDSNMGWWVGPVFIPC